MNSELRRIKDIAYNSCSLVISDFELENESKEYKGCKFKLNKLNIVCRSGKKTPKKDGQFVTFWKRNIHGITEPFEERDEIDYYIINVTKENRIGQFILPKSILIDKGILSTSQKDGKRGFRIYPIWDAVKNQQAGRTQKWQLKYFVEFENQGSLVILRGLLEND